MKKREFRQRARTGKTHIWTIEVVGAEIRSSYGEEGGKLQTVVDLGVGKNRGRSNEVTPEEDALYEAGRAILKKTRAGYTEEGSERATCIDWNAALPVNLRFYKPDNSLSTALLKKIELRTAWLGRKRDGECLVFVKGPDGIVDVYSRTMLRGHHLEVGRFEWRDRLMSLVRELERRTDVPNCSILLGDLVGDQKDDTRWSIASFMKSLTPEAIGMPAPFLYVWDVPFWGGVDLVSTVPVGERYGIIWDVFGAWEDRYCSSWFLPVEAWEISQLRLDFVGIPAEAIQDDVEFAKAVSKMKGWEGWVVVDAEGVYGDKAYNFRGKTDRPGRFCGKLKPAYEDDFVARFDPDNSLGLGHAGKWGAGNNRGMVGSVSLYQYSAQGELVYICECGGGIDDTFREKYSRPTDYPLVLQVEYTARTYKSEDEKTNALTYPRVLGIRTNKTHDECVNPKL